MSVEVCDSKSFGFDLPIYQNELKCILEDGARALAAEGIRYYLSWGTLLGAMRHQDIIPWDDDIDISVHNDDYERALSVLREKCPQYYVWDWDADEKCDLDFARVFTRVRDNQSEENYRAYIDLYRLDVAPRGCIGQLLDRVLITALRRLINRKSGAVISYRPYAISSIVLYCLALPFSLLSVPRLHKFYASIRKGRSPTGYLWYDKLVLPDSWFAKTWRLKFGQVEYDAPIEAERILESSYGDWRQVPPVGQRGEHAYTASGEVIVTRPADELRRS